MTKEPINQHYVPRFYLRRFSEGSQDKVFVLFKKSKKDYISEKPVNLENICAEKYYYALHDNNNRTDMRVEKLLSRFESVYNGVIYKYIPTNWYVPIQKGTRLLDKTQKGLLADSLAMQIRRGISARMIGRLRRHKIFENLIDEAKIKFKNDYVDEDLKYLCDNEERLTENALKMMAIPYGQDYWENSELAKCLREMSYTILLNSTAMEFVTSDEPIILYNHKTKQTGLFKCPLDNAYTNIYYPLGPKSLLFAYHNEFSVTENNGVYLSLITEDNINFVQDLNSMQYKLSHRFIIARKRETLLDML